MIVLGKVIKTQGIRGELKLRLFKEEVPLLASGERVFLGRENNFTSYRVEALKKSKKGYILKLEKVDSIEEASRLVGEEIMVEEEKLSPLEEGEYYEYQLIGSSVHTKDGQEVGKVARFWEFRGKVLMVVLQGKKEILIPFEPEICVSIDVAQRIIVVEPPEGLLDLNEI